MSALTNATLKSKTFWINIIIAAGGAAVIGFQDALTALPAGEDAGIAAIAIAVINTVMRFITQLNHEKQISDK